MDRMFGIVGLGGIYFISSGMKWETRFHEILFLPSPRRSTPKRIFENRVGVFKSS